MDDNKKVIEEIETNLDNQFENNIINYFLVGVTIIIYAIIIGLMLKR